MSKPKKKLINISEKTFFQVAALLAALMLLAILMTCLLPKGEFGTLPDGSPDYLSYQRRDDLGGTQLQAVQDKGAEVLASIPEDYTDLQNEVGDLKSAFDTSRSGGEWSFPVTGGSSNTVTIQLYSGLKYVITNNTTGAINVNALKADGSDVNILNGLDAGKSVTFNPTDNYIGLRGWVVEGGTVSVTAYGYSNDIADIQSLIGSISVGEWAVGGVSSGIETTTDTRIRSERVKMGSLLTVHVYSPYYFGLSFYDENGTFIRETPWMQGEYQFTKTGSEVFVQITLRHANNSAIAVEESSNAYISNSLDDITQNVIELYEAIGKNRAYTYVGEKMPSYQNSFNIVKRLQMTYPASNTSQDLEAYGNYLFVGFSNPESIRVYSLTDYSLLADIEISTNHSASMQFSNEFYADGDELPLLYIGGGQDNTVYVLRIVPGSPWTASVVKTISIPNTLGYYLSPNVDGNTLYLFGYAENSITNGKMKIVRCDLLNMTQNGDGTFTPIVLEETETPYLGVYQGHKYLNGNIYVGFANTQAPYNPKIYGISVGTGDIVTTIDLSSLLADELEGLCFRIDDRKIEWYVSDYFRVFELFF